jgi:hypothetical protein
LPGYDATRTQKGQFGPGNPGGGRPKSNVIPELEVWADRRGDGKSIKPGGVEILLCAVENGVRAIVDPNNPAKTYWVKVDDATWRKCLELALAYGKKRPVTPIGLADAESANSIAALLAGLGSPAFPSGANGGGEAPALPAPRVRGAGVVPARGRRSQAVGDGGRAGA